MEIKKIICKNGREYNIVNETWETSRAWGHKSTLLINGRDIDEYSVRYYNRTWEMYTYQTCMSLLINSIIGSRQDYYITQFKADNGIIRFKKGQKEEIIAQWKNTEFAKDLYEILKRIENRDFD